MIIIKNQSDQVKSLGVLTSKIKEKIKKNLKKKKTKANNPRNQKSSEVISFKHERT